MKSTVNTSASIASRDWAKVDRFVDPTSAVNGGLWTLTVTTTLFLGLRIWTKVQRRHGLWWDDYVLIASWIVLLSTCSLISYELATGYVSDSWNDRMLILVSTSSVLTMFGQAWSKSAFAVTLLRPGITTGWHRWVLWFVLVSLNVYSIITFFLQWTNYCGETPYSWKMPVVCAPYTTIFKIKTGGNMWNIITDFVLALFPWLVTWQLRIKRLEKIGICLTMSLGVIVAVISTWRTVYMMSPGVNNYDSFYFWRQGLSMVWYQSEVAGTIIVQTLPVIRHIARDPTVQRSLVSVPLNQIDTVNQGKIWDGSDTEARGQYSVTVGTGDMETGLTCPGQVHSPVPPLPSRNSWSTYSQNEKKPTAT